MNTNPSLQHIDLRKEFPLREGLIYLNHAMASPWPRRTAEALKAFADENLCQGASRFAEWGHTERELRSRLSRLLNADAVEDIALVKNTSEGLSTVALGIDWDPGRNVVLPMQEYPANRYCWDRLDAQGVATRKVDILATEHPEQALIDACDDQTRLLTVSSVHFGTGLRMGVAWREMGVVNLPSGQPTMELTGGAATAGANRVRASQERCTEHHKSC